jgi:hypothetical protein
MDNQNKEQKSPTNKHFEKKKLKFKFGFKKLEGGGKLNRKACSFSHTYKNIKERLGEYQFKTRGVAISLKGGVQTTLRGSKEVLEIGEQ